MTIYAGQTVRASDITDFMQVGTTLVTFTSKNFHIETVSFDTSFAGVPIVTRPNIASAAGVTGQWDVRAYNVDADGFSLFLFFSADTTSTDSWEDIAVTWTAVYIP